MQMVRPRHLTLVHPTASPDTVEDTPRSGLTTTTDTGRKVGHGTRRCYQKGCRRDECRQANADYKNSRTLAHKARIETFTQTLRIVTDQSDIPPVALASLEHGTANTYEYYRCRCGPCRENMKEVRKERKLNRMLKQYSDLTSAS